MVTEGELPLGKYTMQYIDDVLKNCTLETYRILLTNVTQKNSTFKTICSVIKAYRNATFERQINKKLNPKKNIFFLPCSHKCLFK